MSEANNQSAGGSNQSSSAQSGTQGSASQGKGSASAALTAGSQNSGSQNSGNQGAQGAGSQNDGNQAAQGAKGEGAQKGTEDWVSELNDETKGWLQNKGFKNPAAIIDSYRNYEKLMGVPKERLVSLPDNWSDEKQVSALFEKLGRPPTPGEYGFSKEEGKDNSFTEWAEKAFHETGLSKMQATNLAKKWNDHFASAKKAAEDSAVAETEKQISSLKKEWGMAHGQNEKIARMAVSKLGVDAETIDKIENAIGYAATMKLFHKFGAGTGEADFVTSGQNSGFNMRTPDGAKAEIAALRSDPNFVKLYVDGDIGARRKMEDLHRMAYPT